MSQNEKRLFGRHKKQEEPPLEQTQAVPAVQDEITAEPAAEAPPKRNKYADKMNRKKRRLSKVRIGITAGSCAAAWRRHPGCGEIPMRVRRT
ncbi:MAG: hypothetical protein ACLT4C_10785 [Butyricicoccus sp.]